MIFWVFTSFIHCSGQLLIVNKEQQQQNYSKMALMEYPRTLYIPKFQQFKMENW